MIEEEIGEFVEGFRGLLRYIAVIGAVLAVCISWGLNHSIGWAAWHGFLGWFYVIYRYIEGVY